MFSDRKGLVAVLAFAPGDLMTEGSTGTSGASVAKEV